MGGVVVYTFEIDIIAVAAVGAQQGTIGQGGVAV
jgi:hypothetical protein